MTIRPNNKTISDDRIKHKVGGDANESRFGGTEREMRLKKSIKVPAVNGSVFLKVEQGWNTRAAKKDVLRLVIGNQAIICKREDIEQSLAYMSQGDELVKYAQPIIKNRN